MPREASITYEQVASYSDAIKAEGGKPTPRLIRERHGSGSLGTIHKLFQQWTSNHARTVESPITLPSAIQRTILEFMAGELTVARTDLEDRLAQAQTSINDLALDNERQSEHIDSSRIAIEDLQADKASLEGRIAQMGSELGATRDEALRERQAAEAARIELAKALLRLEAMPRLEGDLANARDDYQVADQRRQEAERSLAVAQSERQSIEQSRNEMVKAMEARLADAQEQQRQLAAQAKDAREALERATEHLRIAQASRAEEATKAAERIGKLEGELSSLEKQLGASQQKAGCTVAS